MGSGLFLTSASPYPQCRLTHQLMPVHPHHTQAILSALFCRLLDFSQHRTVTFSSSRRFYPNPAIVVHSQGKGATTLIRNLTEPVSLELLVMSLACPSCISESREQSHSLGVSIFTAAPSFSALVTLAWSGDFAWSSNYWRIVPFSSPETRA